MRQISQCFPDAKKIREVRNILGELPALSDASKNKIT
jgi:hypothetical protein